MWIRVYCSVDLWNIIVETKVYNALTILLLIILFYIRAFSVDQSSYSRD